MINIALPNGTLQHNVFLALRNSGFAFEGVSRCGPFSLVDERQEIKVNETVLMRPQIMPRLVAEGKYDCGVCGLDWVEELQASVEVVRRLPLSGNSIWSTNPVRIVLIAGFQDRIQSMQDAPVDTIILTEYPSLTRRNLAVRGIRARVEFSHGSTEAHVPRDFRLGVCLTETGRTLNALHLRIVEVLFESQTAIIANPDAWRDFEKREQISKFGSCLSGGYARSCMLD